MSLLGRRGPRRAERAAIARAAARLDRLALYPEPLDRAACGSCTCRGCSALPWFRRFRGYNMGHLILLARPLARGLRRPASRHELCHVWQDQDHRLRMWASYLHRAATRATRTSSRRAAPSRRRADPARQASAAGCGRPGA